MTRHCLIPLFLAMTACSVDPKSNDFACESTSDCRAAGLTDRVCSGGYCVLGISTGDGGGIDAPAGDADPDQPDASPCPEECDSCAGGTCVISCSENGACPDLVECAPGIPCEVNCTAKDSCGGGVDCGQATSCTVNCTGNASCAGAVECTTGPCTIDCSAPNSCGGGVDCSNACACDTNCGNQGCGGVMCPDECEEGGECTSDPEGCNTCT